MTVASTDTELILNTLNTLKEDLYERYQVTKIGIFGSFSRNEATLDSDLDIVVEMEPDMLKRIALKADLERRFQRKVDIVRYRSQMNPHLKSQIEQDAIYV